MKTRVDRSVVLAFGLSGLASLGLAVTYWLGGDPQVEGALLGISLGGLGLGIVGWTKRYMSGGSFVEEREELSHPERLTDAAARDFRGGEELIVRRKVLFRMLSAAVGSLGIALIFPIRSLGPRPGRSLYETPWRKGLRLVTKQGRLVRVGDIGVGEIVTVFPEGHTDAADAQTVLIRMDPEDLMLREERDDWAPQGFVAYSKICTHAGCPVGLYEKESKELFCPCHQSVFDAAHGAVPTAGPATRPLPQLPIEIDPKGFLRALGDFPKPVGPSFWSRGEGRAGGDGR